MKSVASAAGGQPGAPSATEFYLAVRERARKNLTKPGIRIRPKKDVPLFHVDDNNPDILIRKLNGKIERGLLENGVFKVVT